MATLPHYVKTLFDFFTADWTTIQRTAEASTRYPASVLRMYEMNRSSQMLSRLKELIGRCPEHTFEVDMRAAHEADVAASTGNGQCLPLPHPACAPLPLPSPHARPCPTRSSHMRTASRAMADVP